MGFGDIITAQLAAKRIVKLISKLRFREMYLGGEKFYVLHGPLRKSEYEIVNDMFQRDEKGRLLTKDPEGVVAKLLANDKLKLDYILATKMVALADRQDVVGLYVAQATYEQLVINRIPNKNAISAISKSAFRGDLMEWKVNLIEGGKEVYDAEDMKILSSKSKNRMILIRKVKEFEIGSNKDTGNEYVIISGTPMGNKGDSYSIVWNRKDVEGLDEKTLIRAFDLAYYADTVAYGIGKVKKTMEEKDENTKSAVRGLVGVLMKYDIIKDKMYKNIVAVVKMHALGEDLGITGSEFDTEEEAERWIEEEFMQKFREAKKEFEVMIEKAKEQKKMYEEYENKEDLDYVM